MPRARRRLQPLPQQVTGLGIKAGGRLVEDDQLGIVDQGAGQGQPPGQAAGKFAHLGLSFFLQGKEVQQLLGPLASLPRRNAEIAGKDQQVLQQREVRVQGVVLLADADARADLPPVGGDIQAEDPQAARAERRAKP